jgi:hypothetical protein
VQNIQQLVGIVKLLNLEEYGPGEYIFHQVSFNFVIVKVVFFIFDFRGKKEISFTLFYQVM